MEVFMLFHLICYKPRFNEISILGCTHPCALTLPFFMTDVIFLGNFTLHCIQTIPVDGEIIKKESPLRSIVQKCEKFLTCGNIWLISSLENQHLFFQFQP